MLADGFKKWADLFANFFPYAADFLLEGKVFGSHNGRKFRHSGSQMRGYVGVRLLDLWWNSGLNLGG